MAPAALTISILALVVSTTGLATAAFIAPHGQATVVATTARAARKPSKKSKQAKRSAAPRASTTPRALGLLLLNRKRQFPASAIPVVKTARTARNAQRLGGRALADIEGSCAPTTVDVGSFCIDASPYPVLPEDLGDNNWIWATQHCIELGGYLPSAAQLIGAVQHVKLESTADDNLLTASTDEDPTDGLKDAREMTSDLITTTAGGDAAGSEGVSDAARGNPRTGEPDPTPLPAAPTPETLQYLTVYDNGDKGGFAGSEPVTHAENFRCAYAKAPGASSREAN
jgi:hypothetical protein